MSLNDCVVMDYCDGELFKTNQLFQEDPCAFQIQLYYDKIEVCNPIGSFAKKHKLGGSQCCIHVGNNFSHFTFILSLRLLILHFR